MPRRLVTAICRRDGSRKGGRRAQANPRLRSSLRAALAEAAGRTVNPSAVAALASVRNLGFDPVGSTRIVLMPPGHCSARDMAIRELGVPDDGDRRPPSGL